MQTKIGGLPLLFLVAVLFQAGPALAGEGGPIQQAVETRIAETAELRGTRIQVHVDQGLVVLSGDVRLYEQKLVSERVAWTTPGVVEVDNELQVVPTLALTDAAIERAIWMVVKGDAGFVAAGLVVRVDHGAVLISGSFLDFRDPSRLKHAVAAIEGVIDIRINAAFLAAED